MVLSRDTGGISDRFFSDLPSLLRRGDLLVVNDTRVVKGRLLAKRRGGGAVEVFLLAPISSDDTGVERWEALARPSKRLREGDTFDIGGLKVCLSRRCGMGRWEVSLSSEGARPSELLELVGEVPLPPYIKRKPGDTAGAEDAVRYQTVYAEHTGSVAAPTAGLHFDEEMLEAVSLAGVGVARLTLSIGYGTFSPIRAEKVEEHNIHSEWYRLPPETAAAVNATRAEGGRIVAVGTTSVRTLESCAALDGTVTASEGTTSLFLYPGGRPFRVVDAMLTNFHLPRSSLLALVMAFAGTEEIQSAYREAVARKYRFYSYGDAMFIA